jgi:hypothetical protein
MTAIGYCGQRRRLVIQVAESELCSEPSLMSTASAHAEVMSDLPEFAWHEASAGRPRSLISIKIVSESKVSWNDSRSIHG